MIGLFQIEARHVTNEEYLSVQQKQEKRFQRKISTSRHGVMVNVPSIITAHYVSRHVGYGD